ncbi:MAG: hypothetical protein VX938_00690, partial [Myxococcota bacterium]|nr:hypothetical protein [Myxococcota bacterium]
MSKRRAAVLSLVFSGLRAVTACTTESNRTGRFILQSASAPPAAGGPTVDEVLKDGSLVVHWR